jgi:hypothetical protein
MTIEFLDEEVSAPTTPTQPRTRRIVFAGEEDVGPAPAPPRDFFSVEDVFSALGGVPESLAVGLPAAAVKGYRGLSIPERSQAIENEMAFAQRVQQEQADREAAGKATSVGSAIREALPSVAFSGVSMLSGLGGGAAGLLGGPAAKVTVPAGAMAASGVASYRMAGADLLYRTFKTLEENKGSPLTDEEKAEAYRELLPIAQDAGLWEAGPEAVSNVLMMKAGKFIFNLPGFGKATARKLVDEAIEKTNKTLARKVAEKTAVGVGTAGAEVISEGVTAIGQYPAEMAAQQYTETGTTEGAPTEYPGGYVQAVKDVAPATLALTGLMGLGAGGVKLASMPFRQQKSPEQIKQDNIDLDAEREANNLMIPPTDEDAKGLQASAERLREAIVEKKEVYSGLEPTDPATQQLGREIRELERAVQLAEAKIAKRVTPESEQARLAREIATPVEPTVQQDLTVQPAPDTTATTAEAPTVTPAPVSETITEPAPAQPAAPAETPAALITKEQATAAVDLTERFNKALEQTKEFAPKAEPTLQNTRSVPDMVAKKGNRHAVSGGLEETNILDPARSKKRFDAIGYERQELQIPEDMNDRVSERYGPAIANVKSLASPSWQGVHFHGGLAISSSVKGTQRGRVLAHELGHASHSLLGDQINNNPEVLAELSAIEQLLYPGLREKISTASNADTRFFNYLLSADELIAEFNAERIINPEIAAQTAPTLNSLLESVEGDKNLVADRKSFPLFLGSVTETKSRLKVKGLEARKVGPETQDISTTKKLRLMVDAAKRNSTMASTWMEQLKNDGVSAATIKKAVDIAAKPELDAKFNELFPSPQPAPLARGRRGEAGAMLIPTKQDFIDAGQNIYEAGMEFATWARQMVSRFGDAVRQFLGEAWQVVSGIPAKINELAGFLPQAGERGAVRFGRGEEPSQPTGPAPESPEGQTVPQALGNGIDIGPENNMPINRKIDSHIKNFLFLRGFFQSASDRLRRNGFVKLGNAIDTYFDEGRRRIGDANKIMLAPLEAYEAAPAARRKKIEEDFQTFYAAQENGRDTDAIREEMDPIAVKIVDAWQKFGEMSGKENQRVGVKVYDPSKGTWRKIGRVEKFWPRRLKPEYQRALMDPDKYAKEYNEIVEALLESGQIKDPVEAEKYLREYSPEATKNDYFSGIEKARGKPLPEKLYDYSMPVMTDYISRWAHHVSRIEQFGQKTTEDSKTLWDREMETTRDPRTRDYIQAARERVEGYFPNDPFLKGTSALNIWATGLQLGNPASAVLNLIGGSTLNAMIGQPGALGSYVASFAELRNLGQQMRDAKEKGVLGRDLMNIVGDHQAILETNGFAKAGQKTADFLLKWAGFTPAEQMIRTQSLIIGKSFVRNALNSFKTDPNGQFARRSQAWLSRNGFDIDKLIVEEGVGQETDRVLRYFSNIAQGSYTIDQVPIFIDMPVGRFLFKYQKFSTQVMRMSWKNTFEPLFKAMTGKGETIQIPDKVRQDIYRLKVAEARELGDTRKIDLANIPKTATKGQARALALIPAMMWLGSAYVGGEILLRMRDILFGVLMKGPDYEDMIKALEDDERAAALYLASERAWYNLIGIGALGLIGNYAQFFMDWQDRERVKNPLDPPALSMGKDTWRFIETIVDQGTVTAGDIDNYTRSTVSAYRSTKKLAESAAGFLGLEDIPGIKEEMFRREVASINKYARRWAADSGIEYRLRRPTEITATPRTPVNRKITAYLQTSQPQVAAAYAKAYLNTLDKQDRKAAIQSLTSSARNRQPLRLGTGPMDESERKAFLRWLKGKVSAEKYEKVAELDKQYQRDYKKFLRMLPNR